MPLLSRGKMKVKKIDIAWLAGIIDGEGCICMHSQKTKTVKRSGYHCCRLQITNTDLGIIDKVKQIYAEWLISYYLQRKPTAHKTVYVIAIQRQAEAKFVLEKVLPYLESEKKLKAAFFFDYLEQYKRSDGRKSNRRKKAVCHSDL